MLHEYTDTQHANTIPVQGLFLNEDPHIWLAHPMNMAQQTKAS